MITRRSLFGLAAIPFLKLPVINKKGWKFKEKHSLEVLLDINRYCISIDGLIFPCTQIKRSELTLPDIYYFNFGKKIEVDLEIERFYRVRFYQDCKLKFVFMMDNGMTYPAGCVTNFSFITPIENVIG